MPGRKRLAVLLVGCSLVLMGAAQPAPPPPADALTQVAGPTAPGDDLFAAGRFAEATAAYQRAVADDPNAATSLAALARMRLYQHREDEARNLRAKP